MSPYKSNRGSVMLVALIFAAILAIALTSYLKLSLGAGKLANRSFYFNAAQNVADTGLERVLWALNHEHLYPSPTHWSTGGFTARSGFSNEYQGIFPSSGTFYTLSGGAKAQVKVWVGDFVSGSQTWRAVAEATITLGDGTTLTKMSETYLQQRAWGDRGMVSRNGMQFNGSIRVDSWNSHSDTTSTADDVPYSAGISTAEAQIASPELIALQNADIYGYAAIGTDDLSGISVGATGRLGGFSTANGVIDTTRVTYDFTASFPDISAPANAGSTGGYALPAITSDLLLPRTGDVSTGGVYYYYAPSAALNASKTINIGSTAAAKVTIVFSGNVTMGGTSQIIINPDSSLKIYTAGDFVMGGSTGIQNGNGTTPNLPVFFTLLGTRTETQTVTSGMQDITLRGTNYLSAVIFASNANLVVNGGPHVYGSLVGNRVEMGGNGEFHQDLSLAGVRTSGLWKLLKWRELVTASERAVFASHFAF